MATAIDVCDHIHIHEARELPTLMLPFSLSFVFCECVSKFFGWCDRSRLWGMFTTIINMITMMRSKVIVL